MITTFYPPYHFGGDAVYVQQLGNELAARGHEVHVIHCRDAFAIGAEAPHPTRPDHSNVHVHSLHGPGTWPSPLLTHQTGRLGFKRRAVERILDEHDFDVIHYHNVSLVGALDLFGLGDAVKLLTLHDYWLVCPTHVMFRNRTAACTEPHCFRCQLSYRRPPQLWRSQAAIQRAVRQLDRVLVASRFTGKLHRERGVDLPAEWLPLMSSPLDSGPSPAQRAPAHPKPYVLFVGRLVRLKGVQDLIPFFREQSGLDLLIAGTGEYEAELREQARGAGNIHFLGHCDRARLAPLYRGAIATAIPSLTYEISPIVLGESWSCRTPVVARNIGALGEFVERSGGGLRFDTAAELAEKLQALAANRDERDRLGDNGYRAWQRDWLPDNNLPRYLSIIEAVRREKHA